MSPLQLLLYSSLSATPAPTPAPTSAPSSSPSSSEVDDPVILLVHEMTATQGLLWVFCVIATGVFFYAHKPLQSMTKTRMGLLLMRTNLLLQMVALWIFLSFEEWSHLVLFGSVSATCVSRSLSRLNDGYGTDDLKRLVGVSSVRAISFLANGLAALEGGFWVSFLLSPANVIRQVIVYTTLLTFILRFSLLSPLTGANNAGSIEDIEGKMSASHLSSLNDHRFHIVFLLSAQVLLM